MKPPLPFPYALNIGTDIVHLPRITRLLARPSYLTRFTRRILSDSEQSDFRKRFSIPFPPTPIAQPEPSSSNKDPHKHKERDLRPDGESLHVTTDMARWLAGRFAAKEAARKAAAGGAESVSWKEVIVRVSDNNANWEGDGKSGGRPEVVYLDGDGDAEGGRVGRLSISHDGEYVVATVLAAG